MRIGVVQFAPVFGEKEHNLQKIEGALEKGHADLVVLPELCTTGYQFISAEEMEALCEPVPQGPSVQALAGICRRKHCHLVAGIGEKTVKGYFNSAVLIGPRGWVGTYRKVHLFNEEKMDFLPGDSGFPVWEAGKAQIGIMICFDWIFPEAARTLALGGAELLCHPVNLILPYAQDAMVTRSIENRVFSVTANRTGSEKRGEKERFVFTGRSQAVDPFGKVLFRLGPEEETYREAEIDVFKARDKQITPRNHIFEDRRTEYYSLS